MNLFINDIYALLPEFFFICMLVIIIVLAILNKKKYSVNELIISITEISIVGLFCNLILYFNKYTALFYVSNFLIKDNILINSIKIFLVTICIIIFFISKNYYKTKNITSFELPIIMLFSLFGMITTVISNDFVLLYLSLEMQSLSIYALVSSKTNSNISSEAGIKYFILGSFISGFILYGISLLYLITGTTNLKAIELLIYNNNIMNLNTILLGIGLITIGFLFKLSAAPFHNWTPDVFDGSPTIVTLFISTLPKISIFYLIINIISITFHNITYYTSIILLLSGTASVIIGCLGGLYQNKIKRLLAYSTINNMGFILIGLSLSTKQSIDVGLFYIITYIILNIGIFSVLISFIKKKYKKEFIYIDELGEIYKSNNLIGLTLGMNLFSLVGLPPLAGFLSKLYILISLVQYNLYGISIFLVIMSVITSFYYIRLIKILFFNNEKWNNVINILPENMVLFIYLITLFNFYAILHADFVLKLISIIKLAGY